MPWQQGCGPRASDSSSVGSCWTCCVWEGASPAVLLGSRAFRLQDGGTVLSSPGGDPWRLRPWSVVAGLAFLVSNSLNTLLGPLLGARCCSRGYSQELGGGLSPLDEGCRVSQCCWKPGSVPLALCCEGPVPMSLEAQSSGPGQSPCPLGCWALGSGTHRRQLYLSFPGRGTDGDQEGFPGGGATGLAGFRNLLGGSPTGW